MALLKKYKVEWTDNTGTDWIAYIWQEGATTPSPIALVPSGNPLEITYNDMNEDLFSSIVTSTCTLNLIGSTRGEFMEFYTTDEKEFYLTAERGSVQVFGGYIIGEQYSEDYTQITYNASLKFTDNLADLKNFEYLDSGARYIGESDLLTIIDNCLNIVGIPSLTKRLMCYIYEDSHAQLSTSHHYPALPQTRVFQERFWDESNAEAWNCYDVVKYCLNVSGYKMIMASLNSTSHGIYIFNPQSFLNDTVEYRDYSGTTMGTYGDLTTYTSLDSNLKIINSDMQLSLDRVYREGRVHFNAGKLKNILKNGDFITEKWTSPVTAPQSIADYWLVNGTPAITQNDGYLRLGYEAVSPDEIYTQVVCSNASSVKFQFSYRITTTDATAYFDIYLRRRFSPSGGFWSWSNISNDWGPSGKINIPLVTTNVWYTHTINAEWSPEVILDYGALYEIRIEELTANNGTLDIKDVVLEPSWNSSTYDNFEPPEVIETTELNSESTNYVESYDTSLGDRFSTIDEGIYWGLLYDQSSAITSSWSFGGMSGSISEIMAKLIKASRRIPAQILEGTIKELSAGELSPIFTCIEDSDNKNIDNITRRFFPIRISWNCKTSEYNGYWRELLYDYDDELLTEWVENGSYAPWYNFVSSGTSISSGVSDDGEDCRARSNVIFVTAGTKTRININLTNNFSSVIPVFKWGTTVIDVVEGNNYFVIENTSSISTSLNIIADNIVTNFSLTGSIKTVIGY